MPQFEACLLSYNKTKITALYVIHNKHIYTFNIESRLNGIVLVVEIGAKLFEFGFNETTSTDATEITVQQIICFIKNNI